MPRDNNHNRKLGYLFRHTHRSVDAYYFYIDDHPFSFTAILLAVALALASLVKPSFLMLTVPVVIIMAAHALLKYRRTPWVMFAYAVAFVVWWLVDRQEIADLWQFLRASHLMTQGYTEAMALNGSWGEVWRFLGVVSLFFTLIVFVEWRRLHLRAFWHLAALALILFFLFKQGFVRHDMHSAIAWLGFLAIVFVYIPPLYCHSGPERKRQICYLLALVAMFSFSWNSFDRYIKPSFLVHLIAKFTLVRDSLRVVDTVIRGAGHLEAAYEKALAKIRVAYPISVENGPVDIYPYQQAVILANHLPWHPRPVFQSYAAYTPALADRNAEYLRKDGPATVLFDVGTIDNRFPSLDDGVSWPELLTQYRISNVAGAFLQFERNDTPGNFQLIPITESTGTFQSSIAVPEPDDEPIWARIDIEPTWMGRAVTFLFKTPELYLIGKMKNGSERKFRLIPAMARNGFLLSPLIDNRFAFAALASRNWQGLKGLTISAITISGSGKFKWYFKPTIKVAFSHLDIPHQGVPELKGMNQIMNLLVLSSDYESPFSFAPSLLNGPQGQPILSTHAPLKLSLPVSSGTRHMRAGFGLLESAWKDGGQTDGVEFRISTVDVENHLNVVWSRYLEPVDRISDRGIQHIDVNLSKVNIKAVVFETDPGPHNNTAWDHAFWSEVLVD